MLYLRSMPFDWLVTDQASKSSKMQDCSRIIQEVQTRGWALFNERANANAEHFNVARYVVPELPHHVTQRGNRRERAFFGVTATLY